MHWVGSPHIERIEELTQTTLSQLTGTIFRLQCLPILVKNQYFLLLGATCIQNRSSSQCEWSTRLAKGTIRICEDQDIFFYGTKGLAYTVTTDWSEKSWSLYFEKLWQNPVFSRLFTRDGTRLPSECDYLQKNSSLWQLSMNNRHKRECSAVDFAAKRHPYQLLTFLDYDGTWVR